ncbi:hypothetical protein B0H13DRAFT_2335284 [Mycena leptocephala]|nr:hypothetical protein B0H13DRAFT_2335284 [Mycena leptocephala]
MRVSNLGRALVFGLEPVILAKEDMGAQPGQGSTWLHGSLEPALAATSDDHGSATWDMDFVFVLESVEPGYLMSAKMMPVYLFYEVEVEVEDVGEEAGKEAPDVGVELD